MNFKHQIKCQVRSHLLLRYNNWKRGQRQDVFRDVASHVSEIYSLNSERLFKIFAPELWRHDHNVDDQHMVVLPIAGGRLALLMEENFPSKYNVNEMKDI